MELVCFLLIKEETEVFVNSIENDFCESGDKEQVPLLTYLRFGIDHVCKYDQCLCP